MFGVCKVVSDSNSLTLQIGIYSLSAMKQKLECVCVWCVCVVCAGLKEDVF